MMAEIHSDESEASDIATDSEDELEVNSSSSSDSEGEIEELPNLVSRNGAINWSQNPPRIRQARRANVFRQREGPTRLVRNAANMKDVFTNLFTNEMKQLVILHTNAYARSQIDAQDDDSWLGQRWRNIDEIELEAFFGVLLFIGVYRSAHESYEQLWSNEHGRLRLQATMSLNRFKLLLRMVRFDDKNTRDDRQRLDKLAAIRELFDMFVRRCQLCYNPGPHVTVDEQLVGFRGRCGFRVYMSNKPDKYGIKIWTLCDVNTSYCFKSQVYLGRQQNAPDVGQSQRVVEALVQPIHNSGRNVTTDNFFTSYPLALSLLQRGLTLVGTMRQNKPQLPRAMARSRNRELHSTIFGFTNDVTLCSYVPKRSKAVVLLSTMHHDNAISERGDRKPDVILFYNASKGGVDTFDQCIKSYTTNRKTNRWPLKIFFNILDASALNAFIIWKQLHPDYQNQVRYARRVFLTELAAFLVTPHVQRRNAIPQISLAVKSVIKQSGLLPDPQPAAPAQGAPLGNAAARQIALTRCHLCQQRRLSRIQCNRCERAVCKDHSAVVCNNCF